MYDAYLIAQYIMYFCDLKKSKDHTYEYNNTKIQKLLFILYGFYLAVYNHKLLNETPKLWPYGPVFPKVFKKIKKNGFCVNESDLCEIKENDKEFFDVFLTSFGKLPAGALSAWSHQPDSPWNRTKEDVGEAWNESLNEKYIVEYFKDFYEKIKG